ncbi:50S ribosomal protein L11 [archaeon]|nr:50S ribosomal protein L11 [archaeon]
MKESIDVMVEGGKASAGPPLGPALGPLGIKIDKVIAAINEKTKSYDGMAVPVKVIVDTSTKAFEIEVGNPPVSALIKKEIGIEKGSGAAREETAGDLSMEGAIKIAGMKRDDMLAKDTKAGVKEVLGVCVSMGITVEGKKAKDVQTEIASGAHDDKFR